MIDWLSFNWHAQKTKEVRYHVERRRREGELRTLEITSRTRKVEILKEAGLACSEEEPDFYMFHNPFVWMESEFHQPWAGVDYAIAVRIFDIDTQVAVVRDALNAWCTANDPWPPSPETDATKQLTLEMEDKGNGS